jgi:hypothetical protein
MFTVTLAVCETIKHKGLNAPELLRFEPSELAGLYSRVNRFRNTHEVYVVIFQHPVALCRSDLGVSAPSLCNIFRCSFIEQHFTTCFGLNGHLQVHKFCSSVVCAHCNAVYIPLNVISPCYGYAGCLWLHLVLFVYTQQNSGATRTLKAATTSKINKAKCNHGQPT